MFKLHNTHLDVSSDLSNYCKNVCHNISKSHLKLIFPIILAMIESKSIVTTDIVKKFRENFSCVSPSSNIKFFIKKIKNLMFFI